MICRERQPLEVSVMWEAVRKIFRPDEAPDSAPTSGDQATVQPTAASEAAPDASGGAAHASGVVAADPESAGTPAGPAASQQIDGHMAPESMEVSPPDHAPRDLAAEVVAPPPGLALDAAPPQDSRPGVARTEGEAQAPVSESALAPVPAAAVSAPDAAVSETPAEPLVPTIRAAAEALAATDDTTAPHPAVEAQSHAAAPATAPAESPAASVAPADGAAPTLLSPGTIVGGRYSIAAAAEGSDAAAGDGVLTYRAADTHSYKHCWACGSGDNGPSTRFCQNCGAPIQDHPVILLQTRAATDEPDEVAQDGAYFHVQRERRAFGAEGVGIEIGAYSAEGPHHPNEDSYWYAARALCANSARRTSAVTVFADGMGGYAPGSGLISVHIASTVGAHILAALDARGDAPKPLDSPGAEAIVRAAVAAANTMVLDEIAHSGEMGSTLVVALIDGETAYIANIGDSRAYYIDPRGRATAITRDQSLVAQEVRQGYLAESDIYTAQGNNIILHAIGEADVQDAADWYAQPLEPGSYLMICCDGYWKTLHGAVLPDGILEGSGALSAAARRMVDTALTQGSDDNTTVVLIAIS